MAEIMESGHNYASRGVANTGLGLGIAGTALSLLNGGLGGIFGGGSSNPNLQYVSKETFDKQNEISALESKVALLEAEKGTDAKLVDVYERIASRTLELERMFCEHKGAQNVINTQLSANMAVAQNNIASVQAQLGNLTKCIIPIDNVCPQPMKLYNSWTAPTASTTTTQ